MLLPSLAVWLAQVFRHFLLLRRFSHLFVPRDSSCASWLMPKSVWLVFVICVLNNKPRSTSAISPNAATMIVSMVRLAARLFMETTHQGRYLKCVVLFEVCLLNSS